MVGLHLETSRPPRHVWLICICSIPPCRDDFNTMLTGKGITVDAYDLTTAALATTDFSVDDSIIIADDAGATGGIPSDLVTKITSSLKPVLGIGLGGSVFFHQTGALFTRGALSTSGSAYDVHAGDSYAPIWQTPNQVSLLFQNMNIYSAAVPVYAYTITDTVQSETHIGRLVASPNQYSLLGDGLGKPCYSFWGYQGAPSVMTPAGKNLFVNMALGSPCAEGRYVLNSALASTPPAIDGVLNYGEWTLGANQLEMDHGIVAAMNDNLRLYLLLDVLESRVNNLGIPQNEFHGHLRYQQRRRYHPQRRYELCHAQRYAKHALPVLSKSRPTGRFSQPRPSPAWGRALTVIPRIIQKYWSSARRISPATPTRFGRWPSTCTRSTPCPVRPCTSAWKPSRQTRVLPTKCPIPSM